MLCIQKGTMKQPPLFRSAAQCIERLYPFICIGRFGLGLLIPQCPPIFAHRPYSIHAPHHSFCPWPRPQQLGGCRDRDMMIENADAKWRSSLYPHMEPSSQTTGESKCSRDLPRHPGCQGIQTGTDDRRLQTIPHRVSAEHASALHGAIVIILNVDLALIHTCA